MGWREPVGFSHAKLSAVPAGAKIAWFNGQLIADLPRALQSSRILAWLPIGNTLTRCRETPAIRKNGRGDGKVDALNRARFPIPPRVVRYVSRRDAKPTRVTTKFLGAFASLGEFFISGTAAWDPTNAWVRKCPATTSGSHRTECQQSSQSHCGDNTWCVPETCAVRV